MIYGTEDGIVSVAVLFVIQAQDALGQRQEVILVMLKGFRHALQPPTDAVRQGLHQVIRGIDDNWSHVEPRTLAQLFFRPGVQRITPTFDRPIVLLRELAQGVGRCLKLLRAQLAPVVLLRVFQHGMCQQIVQNAAPRAWNRSEWLPRITITNPNAPGPYGKFVTLICGKLPRVLC